MNSEIMINQEFYSICAELSVINDDYYNYYSENGLDIDFLDYFSSTPFILKKDVSDKIKELIIDEKIREDKETRDMYISAMFLVVDVSSVFVTAKILSKLVIKARKMHKISRSKSSKVFMKALSNNKKRQAMSGTLQIVAPLYEVGRVIVPKTISVATGIAIGNAISKYKSEDNKLNGRIGDFSDGIISQHIGSLRIMSMMNYELLNN